MNANGMAMMPNGKVTGWELGRFVELLMTSLLLIASVTFSFSKAAGAQALEDPEAAISERSSEDVDAESVAETARQYSLEELLKLGAKRAAVVEEKEAGVRNAEWKYYRADWAWAPKIQADGILAPVPANTDPNQLSQNFDEIGDLDIGPLFRSSIRVVLPIWTFGKIDAAETLATIGVEVAESQLRQSMLELFFQIKQAYYGIQLAKAFQELLDEGDQLISSKLNEMEEARAFGEADFEVTDLRRLQIFEAELDGRILDNQKLIQLSLAGMAYLTNTQLEMSNIPKLDPEASLPTLKPIETYLQFAFRFRPEVQQLRKAIEAREAQLRLEQAEFFPDVFLAFDFNYAVSTENPAFQRVCLRPGETGPCNPTQEPLFTPPWANPYEQFNLGLALGFRWQFDYVQAYGTYQETKALYEQTQAQQARALGAIELEVEKLFVEASQARQRIAIAERRLQAARRWRDQVGLSIESAGADVEKALDPLQAFYQAQVQYLQAHFDFRVKYAELLRSTGQFELVDLPSALAFPEPSEK